MIYVKKNDTIIVKIEQRRMAEVMGVSKAFVTQILKGERKMPQKHIKKLEKTLGIPPEFWSTPSMAA